MPQDNRITVIQVFRSLGIDPEKEKTWSVGNTMAAMYRAELGEDPPKDNRPKTGGGGSHCFALYPATWRDRIEKVIQARWAVERGQQDLFGGSP